MPIYKAQLAWLAGIIDGEGCITFHPQPKLGIHLCKIIITNTDLGILDAVIEILDLLDIFHTKKMKAMSYNGRKQAYIIQVCRQLAIKYLLELLLPYLKSTKQEKAIKVLEYINNRTRSDCRKPNWRKRGR